MLKRAGYNPILIVSDSWDPPQDSIFTEVETKFLSNVSFQDPPVVNEMFHEDVNLLVEQLKDIIPDGATVLTHDLIFLPDYVKHNIAARQVGAERPGIRWIHWVHSATGPQSLIREREMYGDKYKELLLSKFPNSIIAYPNANDIPRVARNFSYEEYEIMEVPHSTDPTEGMHPVVQRLYDEKHLGAAEVLMIYPIRFDRGKNPQMNVRIQAGLMKAGVSSHLVFCNFQSTGDDKVVLMEECRALARELQVEDRITFISEFDDALKTEAPHQIVLDLFTLSNIFCLPSRSETYSLITQEAMLKGNLCILNHDFPAFHQIFGDKALYRQFDGAEIAFDGFDGKTETQHTDIQAYMHERIAIPLKAWLEHEKVLKGKTWVRTQRNPDYIFRQYIEPLIQVVQDENAKI